MQPTTARKKRGRFGFAKRHAKEQPGLATTVATALEEAAENGTGCLHVTDETASRSGKVYFRDQKVTAVHVDGFMPRLGLRLQTGGMLTPEQYATLLHQHQDNAYAPALGEAAVRAGYIDQAVLDAVLREILLSSVGAMFGWANPVTRYKNGVTTDLFAVPPVSVKSIVKAVAKRRERWEELWQGISAGQAPENTYPTVVPGVDPTAATLSREVAAVLTAATGALTLDQVAGACGLTRFETGHVLGHLVATGAVVMNAAPTGTSTNPGETAHGTAEVATSPATSPAAVTDQPTGQPVAPADAPPAAQQPPAPVEQALAVEVDDPNAEEPSAFGGIEDGGLPDGMDTAAADAGTSGPDSGETAPLPILHVTDELHDPSAPPPFPGTVGPETVHPTSAEPVPGGGFEAGAPPMPQFAEPVAPVPPPPPFRPEQPVVVPDGVPVFVDATAFDPSRGDGYAVQAPALPPMPDFTAQPVPPVAPPALVSTSAPDTGLLPPVPFATPEAPHPAEAAVAAPPYAQEGSSVTATDTDYFAPAPIPMPVFDGPAPGPAEYAEEPPAAPVEDPAAWSQATAEDQAAGEEPAEQPVAQDDPAAAEHPTLGHPEEMDVPAPVFGHDQHEDPATSATDDSVNGNVDGTVEITVWQAPAVDGTEQPPTPEPAPHALVPIPMPVDGGQQPTTSAEVDPTEVDPTEAVEDHRTPHDDEQVREDHEPGEAHHGAETDHGDDTANATEPEPQPEPESVVEDPRVQMARQRLLDEINAATIVATAAEDALARAEADHLSHQAATEQMEETLGRYEQFVANAETDQARLSDEAHSLQQQRNTTEEQHAAAQATAEQAHHRVGEAAHRVEQAREAFARAQRELAAAENHLAEQETTAQEASAHAEDVADHLTDLHQRAALVTSDLTEVEERLGSYAQEIDDVRSMVESLIDARDNAAHLKAAAEQRLATARKNLAAKQERLAQLG